MPQTQNCVNSSSQDKIIYDGLNSVRPKNLHTKNVLKEEVNRMVIKEELTKSPEAPELVPFTEDRGYTLRVRKKLDVFGPPVLLPEIFPQLSLIPKAHMLPEVIVTRLEDTQFDFKLHLNQGGENTSLSLTGFRGFKPKDIKESQLAFNHIFLQRLTIPINIKGSEVSVVPVMDEIKQDDWQILQMLKGIASKAENSHKLSQADLQRQMIQKLQNKNKFQDIRMPRLTSTCAIRLPPPVQISQPVIPKECEFHSKTYNLTKITQKTQDMKKHVYRPLNQNQDNHTNVSTFLVHRAVDSKLEASSHENTSDITVNSINKKEFKELKSDEDIYRCPSPLSGDECEPISEILPNGDVNKWCVHLNYIENIPFYSFKTKHAMEAYEMEKKREFVDFQAKVASLKKTRDITKIKSNWRTKLKTCSTKQIRDISICDEDVRNFDSPFDSELTDNDKIIKSVNTSENTLFYEKSNVGYDSDDLPDQEDLQNSPAPVKQCLYHSSSDDDLWGLPFVKEVSTKKVTEIKSDKIQHSSLASCSTINDKVPSINMSAFISDLLNNYIEVHSHILDTLINKISKDNSDLSKNNMHFPINNVVKSEKISSKSLTYEQKLIAILNDLSCEHLTNINTSSEAENIHERMNIDVEENHTKIDINKNNLKLGADKISICMEKYVKSEVLKALILLKPNKYCMKVTSCIGKMVEQLPKVKKLLGEKTHIDDELLQFALSVVCPEFPQSEIKRTMLSIATKEDLKPSNFTHEAYMVTRPQGSFIGIPKQNPNLIQTSKEKEINKFVKENVVLKPKTILTKKKINKKSDCNSYFKKYFEDSPRQHSCAYQQDNSEENSKHSSLTSKLTQETNIGEEVKHILDKIIFSIELLTKPEMIFGYDPEDTKARSNNTKLPSKIILKERKRTETIVRELNRLDVNIIDEDECSNESCINGCLCSSIHYGKSEIPEHCGKPRCVFECKCGYIKSDTNICGFKTTLLNSLTSLRKSHESNCNLAKEEREFKQTVIRSKKKTIVLGDGNKKREIKLPERFKDSVMGKDFPLTDTKMIIPDKYDVALLSNPNYFDQVSNRVVKRVYSSDNISLIPNSKLVEQRRPKKIIRMQPKLTWEQKVSILSERYKLKKVTILIKRLPIIDKVSVFCMFHSCYDCICCVGKSNASPHTPGKLFPREDIASELTTQKITQRNIPKHRNVAVKSTTYVNKLHTHFHKHAVCTNGIQRNQLNKHIKIKHNSPMDIQKSSVNTDNNSFIMPHSEVTDENNQLDHSPSIGKITCVVSMKLEDFETQTSTLNNSKDSKTLQQTFENSKMKVDSLCFPTSNTPTHDEINMCVANSRILKNTSGNIAFPDEQSRVKNALSDKLFTNLDSNTLNKCLMSPDNMYTNISVNSQINTMSENQNLSPLDLYIKNHSIDRYKVSNLNKSTQELLTSKECKVLQDKNPVLLSEIEPGTGKWFIAKIDLLCSQYRTKKFHLWLLKNENSYKIFLSTKYFKPYKSCIDLRKGSWTGLPKAVYMIQGKPLDSDPFEKVFGVVLAPYKEEIDESSAFIPGETCEYLNTFEIKATVLKKDGSSFIRFFPINLNVMKDLDETSYKNDDNYLEEISKFEGILSLSHYPSQWFVLSLNSNFEFVLFKMKQLLSYGDLLNLVKMAKDSNKSCRYILTSSFQKDIFGVYATPKFQHKVFIGPFTFHVEKKTDVELFDLIGSKITKVPGNTMNGPTLKEIRVECKFSFKGSQFTNLDTQNALTWNKCECFLRVQNGKVVFQSNNININTPSNEKHNVKCEELSSAPCLDEEIKSSLFQIKDHGPFSQVKQMTQNDTPRSSLSSSNSSWEGSPERGRKNSPTHTVMFKNFEEQIQDHQTVIPSNKVSSVSEDSEINDRQIWRINSQSVTKHINMFHLKTLKNFNFIQGPVPVKLVPSMTYLGFITMMYNQNKQELQFNHIGLPKNECFKTIKGANIWLNKFLKDKMVLIPSYIEVKWLLFDTSSSVLKLYRPFNHRLLDSNNILSRTGFHRVVKPEHVKTCADLQFITHDYSTTQTNITDAFKDLSNLYTSTGSEGHFHRRMLMRFALEEIDMLQEKNMKLEIQLHKKLTKQKRKIMKIINQLAGKTEELKKWYTDEITKITSKKQVINIDSKEDSVSRDSGFKYTMRYKEKCSGTFCYESDTDEFLSDDELGSSTNQYKLDNADAMKTETKPTELDDDCVTISVVNHDRNLQNDSQRTSTNFILSKDDDIVEIQEIEKNCLNNRDNCDENISSKVKNLNLKANNLSSVSTDQDQEIICKNKHIAVKRSNKNDEFGLNKRMKFSNEENLSLTISIDTNKSVNNTMIPTSDPNSVNSGNILQYKCNLKPNPSLTSVTDHTYSTVNNAFTNLVSFPSSNTTTCIVTPKVNSNTTSGKCFRFQFKSKKLFVTNPHSLIKTQISSDLMENPMSTSTLCATSEINSVYSQSIGSFIDENVLKTVIPVINLAPHSDISKTINSPGSFSLKTHVSSRGPSEKTIAPPKTIYVAETFNTISSRHNITDEEGSLLKNAIPLKSMPSSSNSACNSPVISSCSFSKNIKPNSLCTLVTKDRLLKTTLEQHTSVTTVRDSKTIFASVPSHVVPTNTQLKTVTPRTSLNTYNNSDDVTMISEAPVQIKSVSHLVGNQSTLAQADETHLTVTNLSENNDTISKDDYPISADNLLKNISVSSVDTPTITTNYNFKTSSETISTSSNSRLLSKKGTHTQITSVASCTISSHLLQPSLATSSQHVSSTLQPPVYTSDSLTYLQSFEASDLNRKKHIPNILSKKHSSSGFILSMHHASSIRHPVDEISSKIVRLEPFSRTDIKFTHLKPEFGKFINLKSIPGKTGYIINNMKIFSGNLDNDDEIKSCQTNVGSYKCQENVPSIEHSSVSSPYFANATLSKSEDDASNSALGIEQIKTSIDGSQSSSVPNRHPASIIAVSPTHQSETLPKILVVCSNPKSSNKRQMDCPDTESDTETVLVSKIAKLDNDVDLPAH